MSSSPKLLGDLLRRVRMDKQLPLPAMAEKLEVDRNTLGGYEREERLPDVEFLGRFARVTGWDAGKLLEARLQASSHSAEFTSALRSIRTASAAAARFAMRRSSLSDTDIAEIQEAAFRENLDEAALEYRFGSRFPVGRQALQAREPGPREGYVYLPLYNVTAEAGKGHLVPETERVVDVLAFKEDWIRQELRATPGDLKLIYVEGDSMEPDLRAGDIVLLDHTDTLARREGIYVIRMDGALLVKQLQRLPGGVVKLISKNPSYEPFTVPVTKLEEPDGFAIIGRVVWACRRF